MVRKQISKWLRFKIFERDGFMCQYCWRDPINFDIVLEVDHSISVKDWWTNDKDNLITSCFDCNRWKWRHSTIIWKLTDIEEEKKKLDRAKNRLTQVKEIKKVRKKKADINIQIHNVTFWFITEKLWIYSESLTKEMNMAIKWKYWKWDSLELLDECLDIAINKFESYDEFYTKDFVKYFYWVLRSKKRQN
jgi:hypothetical protein